MDVDFCAGAFNQGVEPGAHIGSAGFGEGEAEDVFGVGVGGFEDIDYAGGEELGFAGAGAGEDEQRTIDMIDGFFLCWVEFHYSNPSLTRVILRREKSRPQVIFLGNSERS